MSTKPPERELRVIANRQTSEIEIVMLADGSTMLGSISFTPHQAEQFTFQMVNALEHINKGKLKILRPDGSDASTSH